MKRLVLLLLAACSDQTTDQPTPATPVPTDTAAPTDTTAPPPPPTKDASAPVDAGVDAGPTITCTDTFGNGLTSGHGRLDGTIRAVILPKNKSCPDDNDHVMLQVDVGSVTYPIAVNIQSDIATTDPNVRLGRSSHALVGTAWSEGWHTDADLDYPTSLGVHVASFAPLTPAELGTTMATEIKVGSKISIYGYGYTMGDGVHKTHRNLGSDDGAIAIVGTSGVSWLLFSFSQQTF